MIKDARVTDAPIIIIDDDEEDQQIIRDVCDDLKINNRLMFFSNAQKAQDYIESEVEQPFLILCDVNMPRMSGLQLRDALNRNDSLRKKSIPFIFLSTTASETDVNDAYNMPVQGFFEKGHNYEDIKRRIHLIFEYWKDCIHPKTFAPGKKK